MTGGTTGRQYVAATLHAPEVVPLASDIDVTGEFPIGIGRPRNPARHHRWSPARWGTLIALLVATAALAVDLTMRPHHGAGDLPQVALDVLRGTWIFALVAVLVTWAYDVIARKVFAFFATIRQQLGDIEDVLNQAVARQEQQRAHIFKLQRAIDANHEVYVSQMGRVREALERVAEKVEDAALTSYAEGFGNALDREPTCDRGTAVIPGQLRLVDGTQGVVSATGGHSRRR